MAAEASSEARVEAGRAALVDEGAILCVRLGDPGAVLDACRAAMRGGLRALELTLTTPGALAAMETLAAEGVALVGAGTVLTPDDARRAADAGGRFAMSPVFDPAVVDEAHRLGLVAVPGTSTPGEILAAHRAGARLVKVFPAGALGGPAYLRALRGPLPDVALVPTSGPTAENLGEYLAAGAAAVGVGPDFFPPGFTPATVEAAAGRVRAALETARAMLGADVSPGAAVAAAPSARARGTRGAPAGEETRVSVSRFQVAGHMVQGITTAWEGGQFVTIVAKRGMVACGIFDPAVCQRFDFAVAMAHGTPDAPLVEPKDVLRARVDTISPKARALGIREGMTGEQALARLVK